MEIKIVDEEQNELLNRKEIRFSVVHDGETPSRLEVRDSLAAKLDRGGDEVVVHEMNTRFGMNETLGYAKVYESPDSAEDVEEDYMIERNREGSGGEEEPEPEPEASEEDIEEEEAEGEDEEEAESEGSGDEDEEEEEEEAEA